jgi:cytochrome b561
MSASQARFSGVSRLLHWVMAVAILAMLFIGIGMVASVSERYEVLVAVHRPLGIAILILVVIRLANRLLNPAPALPATMPSVMRLAATASHILLYALMFVLPLVGWGMLSAARYPIVLAGGLQLPPILPHDIALYAWLRPLHTDLAYLLFATFLAHLGAALCSAAWPRGIGRSRRPCVMASLSRGRTAEIRRSVCQRTGRPPSS